MPDSPPTPSIGVMLGAACACPEIKTGNRIWKVGYPTQASKSELEKLAVAVAGREIYPLKDALPPAQYKELSDSFTTMVSSGHWKTWRPGWIEVTTGNPQLFFLALLRVKHPEASEEDAIELSETHEAEVGVALAQVLPVFIKLLLRLRKDLTPEQQDQVAEQFAARLIPGASPEPLPQPTVENTAT